MRYLVLAALVVVAPGARAQADPPAGTDGPLAPAWELGGVRRTETGVATVRLRDGRFLFCGGVANNRLSGVCELWNPDDRTWSAAPALAQARREVQLIVGSDGTVWAAGGYVSLERERWARSSTRVEVWSPGAPAWRTVSELPVPEGRPRLIAHPPGRITAVYTGECRLAIWETTLEASGWKPVSIDPGGPLCYSEIGAWGDGTLVFVVRHPETRELGWAIRPPRSTALRTQWLPGEKVRHEQLLDWQDDSSLLVTESGGRWTARLVTAGGLGQPRSLDSGEQSAARAVAMGDGRVVIANERQQWLWDPARAQSARLDGDGPTLRYGLVASRAPGTLLVTDQRPHNDLVLLWTAPPAAVAAPPLQDDGHACAGIEQFLQVGIDAKMAGGWAPGNVERYAASRMGVIDRAARGACRQAATRGQASSLTNRLSGWSALPSDDPRARVAAAVACSLEIREATPAKVRWLTLPDFTERWLPVRAACLADLAEHPDTRPSFDAAALVQVRDSDNGWELDPALVAAARRSAPVRQRAGPALALARKRHARGHDALLAAVCFARPAPTDAEIVAWCRMRDQESRWTAADERARELLVGTSTTVVAVGLVAGAHLGREQPFSRGIASGAGALGGLTIGGGLGALIGLLSADAKGGKSVVTDAALGAAVGAMLGGFAAYQVAEPPGRRGATTAAGLAVPYLLLMLPNIW